MSQFAGIDQNKLNWSGVTSQTPELPPLSEVEQLFKQKGGSCVLITLKIAGN